MDYATLQKGYETLSKAALSGDRLTMEESIKDWNSLYKARQEMRGHEEEAFNKGQEEFEKEENDPGFKEAHNDGKSTEKQAPVRLSMSKKKSHVIEVIAIELVIPKQRG